MFSKEIPGERSPRLQSSLGSSRHDIERFRDLSLELLKYSTQGLLRKDFLPMVSERIMEFSECDALELWVKEDPHKHFRCSVAGSKKMPFGFILVPCPLGEATDSLSASTGAPSMEKLCCNIIKGSIEKPHPCYTGKGSFWTNTADGQTHPLCKERLPGFFSSIAVIPIKLEEECVGLLQLKTRRPGFFSSRDVAFYEDIASILGIAFSHQYAQVELRERIKELTCLYGIARVVAQRDASFDEIMQGIADLLPPAWLFPEIASARIVLNGKSYETQGYGQTPHRQVSDVVVKDEKVGFVEVSYREKKLTMDEGPFLSEERSLINSVAREVAIFYERSKGEEEKALLQDQLRHADRLATIGQLAAGVAHELNEPLGNILGFAQLALKERGLPGQSEKDLRRIESASLHAREIIKKLMAFARQLPPAKVPVDLNDVVNESLYLFEARCAKSGIELVRDLAPNLPEITIDPGQMNQVLVNLVVNAIQAMPKGGSLSVKTRETEEGGCLIVEDTGLGMSEESKKQIFLPFFTTKDINEGTGLGLAVVHGIVSSHGGRITVKTREGEGTRFAIHLPSRGPKQA